VTGYDFALLHVGQIMKYLLQGCANPAKYDFLPLFGDEYQVVFAVPF